MNNKNSSQQISLFEPKFKVGDIVTTNTDKINRIYTVDEARRGIGLPSSYGLTVVGTNVKDFAYESSLRLLTPEEKTKLLLGIDLYE